MLISHKLTVTTLLNYPKHVGILRPNGVPKEFYYVFNRIETEAN